MRDERSTIWARTTTLQQLGLFAGVFVAAILVLLWVTKGL